jgi:DNA-binding NtrC family response regulator
MAKILIVDDELGIRELFSEILTDEGHIVLQAENAIKANGYMLNNNPELVLLDIWMPEMDGITLLKEWSNRGMLTIPVIMMSGHGTIDTAVEATKIGAIDYLEKPISLQKLLETVHKTILSHPTQNEKKINSVSSMLEISNKPIDGSIRENSPMTNLEKIALQPFREAKEAFEKMYFETHIKLAKGNLSQVATNSGIERAHVYRKIKQLNISYEK